MEKIALSAGKAIRIGFALLFILVPLAVTPWNYELFEYNKMMVTYGLAVIIAGAWIIKMIAEKEMRIRKTPLDIPILLFVLSQLISALFSMDPHVSWFGYYSRFNGGMLSVITYVVLYYACVSNIIPQSEHEGENEKWKMENGKNNNRFPVSKQPTSITHRLLTVIFVTGFIVSLYGIAEHFGIDKDKWVQDVRSRVFSTLGQPNWLAAYLIAIIPVTWGLLLNFQFSPPAGRAGIFNFQKIRLPVGRIIWSLFSAIFFITFLWTRSRSGFLAFFTADLIFWTLIFINFINPRLKKLSDVKSEAFKKFTDPFIFVHIIFFLIIIINGTYIRKIDDWITVKAWGNRLSQIVRRSPEIQQKIVTTSEDADRSSAPLIESGVTDSGDIRKYVWQGAVNAWRSSPKAFLIGTGTETYAFAFYLFKPAGHNLTSEWDFLYNKAHNEYLNFLATTGVLGLGTYLILIGTFIIWSIKFLIRKEQAERDVHPGKYLLSIGLFSGWMSILITNFFGFSVVITQLMLYLFPAIIFTMTVPEQNFIIRIPMEQSPKWQKRAMSATGVISALLLACLSVGWLSDKQFARGYHLSRAGYLPQAYQALTSAISLNPTEPIFHDEQANVMATLSLAAWKENQATTSRELALLSIKENDTALAISPNNVNFWKSRTKIFFALSSIDPVFFEEAITALEKSLALSPLDPKIYYNLSILYRQAGLADKSLEFMKKSIELKPNYREGYYGLSELYKERGMPDKANEAIKEYLEKVDPTDEEFKKIIQ